MHAMIRFVVGDSRIYLKAQEEIDDAVRSCALAFPVTYAAASALPYF